MLLLQSMDIGEYKSLKLTPRRRVAQTSPAQHNTRTAGQGEIMTRQTIMCDNAEEVDIIMDTRGSPGSMKTKLLPTCLCSMLVFVSDYDY